LVIEIRGEDRIVREQGAYHRIAGEAIAEPGKRPKSSVTPPASGDDGGDQFAGSAAGLSALVQAKPGIVHKSLCMAVKRFDLAACHAIDHRQPYRWASIRR
jgi:hypothetical protein